MSELKISLAQQTSVIKIVPNVGIGQKGEKGDTGSQGVQGIQGVAGTPASAFIHVGTVAPTDTTKIWFDTN